MNNRAISIVGECSNVGKTTLIKNLLEIFSKEGLKVGVVKHHHREFDFDREGKDSYIFSKSGASCVKMVSPNRVITVENLNYEKSLNEIIRLNPEHISSYSLIVEEGTPFFKKYSENAPLFGDLPSEDEDREMYTLTSEKLGKAGYERYEISNYAKKGFYSRHNTSYWDRVPYLGFGVGASSFFEDERYKNRANLKEYIEKAGTEDIREEITKLSLNDAMSEFMFLGLRKIVGISKSEFKSNFTFYVEEIFGENIKKYINNKLLIDNGEFLRLSDRGLDISNYVISDFLLDWTSL